MQFRFMRKGEKHRKYSLEEKLGILEYREENNLSTRELSDLYEISVTTLRDWIRIYEAEGASGLCKRIPGKPEGRYTPEFRASVVQGMIENDWSYTETAKQYGIHRSVVQWWMRAYQEGGAAGLEMRHKTETKLDNPNIGRKRKHPPKPSPKAPQDKELLDELHRLRMENEYLKKLNALARQKELLGRRKKLR